MTRLAALTAAAVAAGLAPEQAEELSRNICAQMPTALEDCALAAIGHRLEQSWLAEPACGVARLAEQLAAAWVAHDAEVEAALRRLVAVIEYRIGFGREGYWHEVRAALTAAREMLGPDVCPARDPP